MHRRLGILVSLCFLAVGLEAHPRPVPVDAGRAVKASTKPPRATAISRRRTPPPQRNKSSSNAKRSTVGQRGPRGTIKPGPQASVAKGNSVVKSRPTSQRGPVRRRPAPRRKLATSVAAGERARPKPGERSSAAPIERQPVEKKATTASTLDKNVLSLRQQLDGIAAERLLKRLRVGVEVLSLRSGDVLYSRNADRLFNPASNTKLLTTAAALALLGKDYRYRTSLHGAEPDEDGVIVGDVDLRGSGDPSLTTTDLAGLARQLAARGVIRIEGAILADGRARDPAGKRLAAEAGSGSGLILNRNGYTIRVRPTAPGRPALVDVQPQADYFSLRATVKTVPKRRTRLRTSVSREEGRRLVVHVSGRVRPGRDVRIKQRIGDASFYATSTLKQALNDFGVEVQAGVRSGSLPAEAPLLAEHWSKPLADVCRVSNKDSNNFVAEAIFRSVGGGRFGLPGSMAKGRQAVAEIMKRYGLAPSAYRMVNGSGLTHENRISPSALAQLLRRLYFELPFAPEFLASLAVAGIDGTIRGRFHGTGAAGLVRAKTGTLSGVSALSGYVGKGDDVLVFAILMEGFRHKRTPLVRTAQVRMVTAMLRYLQATAPPTTVPPTLPPSLPSPTEDPVEEPGDDDEATTSDEAAEGGR